MIELVTGTPGAGKTLYTLWHVNEKSIKESRPVYYSGIPELNLPWTEIDPEKWFDAPPNSIIIIDECQRIFRPRSFSSKVPDYVERLETHRHQGIDLVFITQHPMLIDSNVRRLVGRHVHVSRRFGLKHSTILEFPSCKDQPLAKSADAVSSQFKFPAQAFEWYKSAEVHTHKARIPFQVWLLLLIPVALSFIVWHFYDKWWAEKPPESPAISQSAGPPSDSGFMGLGKKSDKTPLTPAQYLASHTARVPGVLASAPFYDDTAKPTRAPYPVGCISSRSSCKCYTVQGGVYFADAEFCRQVLRDGFYKWWDDDSRKEGPTIK